MFDTHAHVNFYPEAERSVVIDRLGQAGLFGWLEIGTTVEDSQKAIELVEKHEGAYASVGIHPDDLPEEINWDLLSKLTSHPKVKAIGEVGFDFYREGTQEKQEPALRKFIDLALQKNLPVIFHVRDGQVSAHEALINLLKNLEKMPAGVVHTFSGSVDQAKQYLDLGMYISFSGTVTFKNAGELTEIAKLVPADKFVIETDSPFLTPVPYRGKQNEPAYVKYVAEKLAELRNTSLEEIEKLTDVNAKKLFQL